MNKDKSKIIPYVLIIISLILISIGIFSGEAKIVFGKAIFICFECIGIG